MMVVTVGNIYLKGVYIYLLTVSVGVMSLKLWSSIMNYGSSVNFFGGFI